MGSPKTAHEADDSCHAIKCARECIVSLPVKTNVVQSLVPLPAAAERENLFANLKDPARFNRLPRHNHPISEDDHD